MTKRDVIIFVAGAAVGGAVAWLIAKDHYTNFEIALPAVEFEKKEEKQEEASNNFEKVVDETATVEGFRGGKKPVFSHEEMLKKEELEKLAEKYRSKFWDNPPAGIDWEVGDAPPPKEGPADAPFIISEEDFSEGCLTNDKVTLYYHALDDTMIEEGVPYEEFDQKMVEDAIGEKNINALKASDEGIIYVRNEGLGIDYMIIMERDSYGADVLGASR